ncbi:MAG: hypothetical protein ACJAQT_000614 [Akkermansiaceae bacterium]|jgi:hypothetical protein
MSVRRLRQILTYLSIILATLVAMTLFLRFQEQKGLRQVASQITQLCELPDIPEEITVRHATIDRSENQQYIDVILALSGPTETLSGWLEKVDEWEKKRPGVIQNHKTREAEMSSRVDFSAEVYLE